VARRNAGVPADLLLAEERAELTYSAGRWALAVRRGELDDIRFDEGLALRGIRFVVRDRDWGTVPSRLVSLSPGPDSLTLVGRAENAEVDVDWRLEVRVAGDSLAVTAEARATRPFLRNRMGLIVLQPAEAAGAPLTVGHADGRVEAAALPTAVSPHQPARDIAWLGWRHDGLELRAEFDGDVFEMEDQRNWTDASFKVYSTPLTLPFPVRVDPGDITTQSVTLTAARIASPPVPATADPTLRVGAVVDDGRMPAVTLGASTAPRSRGAAEEPAAVLAEVDVRLPGWRAWLNRLLAGGVRALDLRIVAANIGEVAAVLDALPEDGGPLARIAVFDPATHLTEPEVLDALAEELRRRALAPEILAGTRAHFTELNRNHDRLSGWDGPLTFSVTPFMHDLSGHQLIESLAVQRTVVHSARAIAGARPLHIGPITLGARFNAVATSPFSPTGDADADGGFAAEFVPGATDARQHAPSLGAWVVGSLAALATPGVASLAYFESSGPRGVTTAAGVPTEAGVVLGWAAELGGAALLEVAAPRLAAVGARRDDGAVVLLGNTGADAVALTLPEGAEARLADGGTPTGTAPLVLEAGAAARVALPR
jgi:hypothetical protein